MAKRDVVPVHKPDWQDTARAGTQVKIRGERGTYAVHYEAAAGTPCGEHVMLFGGAHTQYRHVRPDQVIWPRTKRQRSA